MYVYLIPAGKRFQNFLTTELLFNSNLSGMPKILPRIEHSQCVQSMEGKKKHTLNGKRKIEKENDNSYGVVGWLVFIILKGLTTSTRRWYLDTV